MSNFLLVMRAEQSCLSARSELSFGGSSILRRSATSRSRKTRARGVRRHSSGRNLRWGRFRPINAAGLRACGYKTAPGRSNWPNRDPIGEKGGQNLYVFAHNAPVHRIDALGLRCTIGQKTNPECEYWILPFGHNPASEAMRAAAAQFIQTAQTASTVASVANLVLKGASAADAILSLGYDIASPEYRAIMNLADQVAKDLRGHTSGYYIHTRITYEECVCGIFRHGKERRPSDKFEGWRQNSQDYPGYTMGNRDGLFLAIWKAAAIADRVCDAHLEEWRKAN
jgi:hypothetical protein